MDTATVMLKQSSAGSIPVLSTKSESLSRYNVNKAINTMLGENIVHQNPQGGDVWSERRRKLSAELNGSQSRRKIEGRVALYDQW